MKFRWWLKKDHDKMMKQPLQGQSCPINQKSLEKLRKKEKKEKIKKEIEHKKIQDRAERQREYKSLVILDLNSNIKIKNESPTKSERTKKHDDLLNHMTKSNIPYEVTRAFYETEEWKKTRDKWLKRKKRKLARKNKVMSCVMCGAIPDPNYRPVKPDKNRSQAERDMLEHEFQANRLLVDHRLPIKYFWHLRLEPSNFQTLCGHCNKMKCNTYSRKDLIELNRASSNKNPHNNWRL